MNEKTTGKSVYPIVIIDCERCKEIDDYIRLITASKKNPEIIDVKTAYDTWKRTNQVVH